MCIHSVNHPITGVESYSEDAAEALSHFQVMVVCKTTTKHITLPLVIQVEPTGTSRAENTEKNARFYKLCTGARERFFSLVGQTPPLSSLFLPLLLSFPFPHFPFRSPSHPSPLEVDPLSRGG